MFKIVDSKKQTLHNWENAGCKTSIKFTVHNKKLLVCYEGKNSITVFYGFLDQKTQGLNNAKYMNSLLNNESINVLNKCYGSFILIHCQLNTGKIIIANDALGDFAVNYRHENKQLHLSDFPKPVLKKDNIKINNERVIHFFALTQPQNNGCFFKGINQLNPGQCLHLENDKIKVTNYYQPPTKVNYKIKSTTALSDSYIALMQEVIGYQTKGQDKIGLMMSGGMDSTFVAVNSIKAKKNLFTFSYVFPNMPQANESIWIDSMRPLDLKMHTFSGEIYWPLKSPWYISQNSPMSNPYRLMKDVIYRQSQDKKINVLLTGVFADHLYTGYIYGMVDKIKRNPIGAIKTLIKSTKKNGVKSGLKQLSPGKWRQKTKIKAPWLTKEVLEAMQAKVKSQPINKTDHPQQYALTYGISTAQSNWLDNEYAFKSGVTVRHPYRDRRIVEFITTIPAWILGDINTPKKFARKAAQDLLPASIIRRQKTTTLKPMFIKGVMDKELEKVKKLLNSPTCQWHKFVKKDLIENILKNPKGNHSDDLYMVLWQCISFELWRKTIKTQT